MTWNPCMSGAIMGYCAGGPGAEIDRTEEGSSLTTGPACSTALMSIPAMGGYMSMAGLRKRHYHK